MIWPADSNRRRAERRRAERRDADRRAAPQPATSTFDTWFNVWGDPSSDGRQRGPLTADAVGSGAATVAGAAADSGYVAREARRMVLQDGAALPRILRTYVAARAALGMALVLMPWAALLLVGGRLPLALLLVSVLYAGQAISLWLLHGAREPEPVGARLQPGQWLATIGVDLLAFSVLRIQDPTPQLNFAALLVLPVLMSGVLTRRVAALATAAGVALLLLINVWIASAGDGDLLLQLSQAGLAGAGMFLVALLASELATRLAGEERTARQSMELARQQAQLNRVVIEEMAEGVLVVDRAGSLRAVNPAGRQLLGDLGEQLSLPFAMASTPALAGLHQALEQAYALGRWPEALRDQRLALSDGSTRAVQVRARFTRRSDIAADGRPPEDICVLFIDDLRLVRARQRQDKLAAMGRVSAGIAHEIRNPLAAIAQANALLLEDPLAAPQLQLAQIVADNVARLKRIVDDVMAVAPDAQYQLVTIDAVDALTRVCSDWMRTAPADVQAAVRVAVQVPQGPLPVKFDLEHLRRVLVNLLDNAVRHATAEAGAVQVLLAVPAQGRQALLTVASDGEPVASEVERHLFEPFFSTRSRGSGLGLYICRELCERHGASIDFHLGPSSARHRNVFSLTMRLA